MYPIPQTSFVGDETSVLVNGISTPVKLVTVQSNMQPVSYMAATITPEQERSNFQSSSWMASFVPYNWWHNQLGMAFKVERETPFIQMLRGQNISGSTYSVNPNPVPGGSSTPIYDAMWVAEATMQGPANSFTDLLWVPKFTEKFPLENPTSITIGVPVSPQAATGVVRVFSIQSGVTLVNASAVFDTLRFVKMPDGPLPFADYSWELTVNAASGNRYNVLAVLHSV
jgi:hypothetical protein